MPKLLIQLVTWNGKKYIPYLFDSLRKQMFTDFHLYIFDNGSTDGTQDAIEKELHTFSHPHTFVKNTENIGFAGGHNWIYKKTRNKEQGTSECRYILLLNQDMYLTPECIQKMVTFLDTNQHAVAVAPRLMHWNFGSIELGLEKSFTHEIDSLGLKIFRNRRVVEKYGGKLWEDKKSRLELSFRTQGDAMEVFGISGALPMFRVAALEVVAFEDGSFFDSSYSSYKEDVDLAYRLRIAGFTSYVLLGSVAYHDRSAAGLERVGDLVAAQNKKIQSAWVKQHSYKNHLMTLYKNEYGQNFILDFLFILWYELKKFVYFLLFDRSVLKGIVELYRMRKELVHKRKNVIQMRKISYHTIREWWLS